MCGIAGSYPVPKPEQVEDMLDKFKNSGPDGRGMDELEQASLGHVRLAVLDIAGG